MIGKSSLERCIVPRYGRRMKLAKRMEPKWINLKSTCLFALTCAGFLLSGCAKMPRSGFIS